MGGIEISKDVNRTLKFIVLIIKLIIKKELSEYQEFKKDIVTHP